MSDRKLNRLHAEISFAQFARGQNAETLPRRRYETPRQLIPAQTFIRALLLPAPRQLLWQVLCDYLVYHSIPNTAVALWTAQLHPHLVA